MADDRINPSDQIPDADLLEQQTPLDSSLTDSDIETVAETATRPVDEADLLDQLAPLPVDDADEYPNTRESGPGGDV